MPWGLGWLALVVDRYGRKYSLALFAGVSSFVVVAGGMWIVARVAPDTGRIVEGLVSAYLLSAAGMVTAYTAGNAVVERAHAGTPKPQRPSGAVTEPVT